MCGYLTRTEGIVVQETNPWSYEVETPSGIYRKNRHHIIPLNKFTKNQDENGKTSPDMVVVSNPNQDTVVRRIPTFVQEVVMFQNHQTESN